MPSNNTSELLYFPSQAWFARYAETINGDELYNQMSEGWGVNFDGDIVFEMTEMPVEDLDTDAMPESLKTQLDTYMKETGAGYTGYAYLGLEDGRCTGSELVESPDGVDAGFLLSATNDNWEELLRGEIDIVQGLMSGKFELDGDMQKILQYTDSAQRLTSLAASIDAVFAREEF